MISRISIENFRCIENLELNCKGINIFVGRNNTGKSSILYAIKFALTGDVPVKNLIKLGKFGSEIKLTFYNNTELLVKLYKKLDILTLSDEERNIINDQIEEFVKEAEFILEKKFFFFPIERQEKRKWLDKKFLFNKIQNKECYVFYINNKVKKILLGNVPNTLPSEFEDSFNRIFRKWKSGYDCVLYRGINIMIAAPHIIEEIIMEKKSLLPWLYNFLKQNKLIEGLEYLTEREIFIKTDNKFESLTFEDLSDGTKALILILLLFHKTQDGVLLLEEPENHMHPGYLNLLVKHLVDYYRKFNVQIFITTHSLDLIDAFLTYLDDKPEIQEDFQIIYMKREDSEISADVVDYKKAKELHRELSWDLRGI